MRRMITSKQLDYVSGMQKVAEPGLMVGTYPLEIYLPEEGQLSWVYIQEQEEDSIDYENHTFSANLMFKLPKMLEHYGLGEDGEVGHVEFALKSSITMPNTVTDFASLKAWMQTQAFVTAVEDAGYSFDEVMLYNDVARYIGDDPTDAIVLVNGELKVDTYVECNEGLGEQIVGASSPIGEPAVQVENLIFEQLRSSKEIISKSVVLATSGDTLYVPELADTPKYSEFYLSIVSSNKDIQFNGIIMVGCGFFIGHNDNNDFERISVKSNGEIQTATMFAADTYAITLVPLN